MNLGDAGAPNDDASYTGDTGNSAFSLQYFRNKASEFQAVLNALDNASRVAEEMLSGSIDVETATFAANWLAEFDAKKWQFRTAAEAINAGAALMNSAGGRFPSLSIPSGLGAVPLLVPAATIAAIGAAAALIVWGNQAIKSLSTYLSQKQMYDEAATPEAKAEVTRLLVKAREAESMAENPVSTVANAVKYIAIAAGAFMAYKIYSEYQSKRSANPILEDDSEDDDEGDD